MGFCADAVVCAFQFALRQHFSAFLTPLEQLCSAVQAEADERQVFDSRLAGGTENRAAGAFFCPNRDYHFILCVCMC
jgi:hypothetical protein